MKIKVRKAQTYFKKFSDQNLNDYNAQKKN